MQILDLLAIKECLNIEKAIEDQENAFIAYSRKQAIVPPVGHIHFTHPPGEYHIKYGMITSSKHWVVKIAGGFYQNQDVYGYSTNQGMIAVFSAEHGKPLYLLQDEGYLTDLRTGIAGILGVKHILKRTPCCMGIIGSGTQAEMQARLLCRFYPGIPLLLWARNSEKSHRLVRKLYKDGFSVTVAKTIKELAASCDYIVTTTASSAPMLFHQDIRPGTHITAIGADAPGKQELSPLLVERADYVIADSIEQCSLYGEISYTNVKSLKLHELGSVIAGDVTLQRETNAITVADLTGVAVQDIAVAETVINAHLTL